MERLAWVTRDRLLERQGFQGHPPEVLHQAHLSVRHQPAHHLRSPDAPDAGPLLPEGLALDPRHHAP